MPKKKKEVEVIDMGGAKTVKKKKSFVTRVKIIFAVISVIWSGRTGCIRRGQGSYGWRRR